MGPLVRNERAGKGDSLRIDETGFESRESNPRDTVHIIHTFDINSRVNRRRIEPFGRDKRTRDTIRIVFKSPSPPWYIWVPKARERL